jgi:hypothetical protein
VTNLVTIVPAELALLQSVQRLLSDYGEIGEPSVVLSSYLRDIYICMFVLSCHFATQGPICHLAVQLNLGTSDSYKPYSLVGHPWSAVSQHLSVGL